MTAWNSLEERIRQAGPAALRRLEAGYRGKKGRGRRDLEAAFVLGRIALARGELRSAESALRRALESDPGEPAFLLALGEVLLEQGRFAEADPLLRAAGQARPLDALAQFALARNWIGQGRLATAETALRRARALAPDSPAVLAELGRVTGLRGRMSEARRCLEEALAGEPDPQTRLTILDYLARLGAGSAATRGYRAFLRDHPESVRACYNLAFKAGRSLEPAERRALEALAQRPSLNDAERAAVHFALAGLADRENDFAAAVEHARAANAAMSDVQNDGDYDPAAHQGRVDKIIETFDAERIERGAQNGDRSRLPVFIVGMPRAGTSLVEQILASHSSVFGGGELAVVNLSLERLPLLTGHSGDPLDCLGTAEGDLVARSARYCMDAYLELAGDLSRVTDKFPDNYLHLGWIRMLFPGAAVIHCVRDERDVAVSCWLNRLPQLRWSYDLEHITARIEQYRRLMAHWRGVLPGEMLDVIYEELVGAPESQARRITAACGLDWEPGCMQFHANARIVETASYRQVRRPVYESSRARWRHYSDVLAPFASRLKPAAEVSG